MGRSCEVCGRGTVYGNRVSHSNRKTRRTWKINLVSMKGVYRGVMKRMKVCTRCLRSNKVTKKVRQVKHG